MKLIGLIIFSLVLTTSVRAQQSDSEEAPAPISQAAERDGAEYKFRPLPADTFKPSEKISEDYPVPFPVDI